ncbi:unnamed protein product [Taenia asiatica]|uniref:GAF domain-containing protein n=1 Tax=Taenia asiatica TaxID=60517 RepID=A0A0R3VWK2_TAEAS|nr:unnamed protein product [Taenia asiatica]
MEQSDLPGDNANSICPFCRPKEFKDFESIEDAVFAWLDDNTNTLRNYIYSHASQSIVEDLLRASTFKKSKSLYPSQYGFSRMNSLVTPQLKNKQMPIRKISSSEFEPLAFHPILATGYDGCQSFLASPSISGVSPKNEFLDQIPSKTVSTETSGLTSNISPDQEEKPEGLKALADSFKEFYSNEVMKELVLDIWSDSDLSSLCFKILRNACLLLNADRASLFIVEVNSSTGERFLVSKLFDVTAKCTLAEALHKSEAKTVSLPFGVGIVGWVAQTGEAVNISNVYEDPRFNREVDLKTGFHTRCLICMPIKDGEGNVLAVAQVMNKKQQKQADDSDTSLVFSSRDVNLFEAYTSFCGIGLHHAQILFRSQLETRRSQVLLELARLIFSDQSDISRLIYSILMHSQSLLTCQRCQILLVNDLKEDTPNADVFGAAYDYTWKDRELDLNEILKRGHRYVAFGIVSYIYWSIIFTDLYVCSLRDRRANAFDRLMEVAR